MTGSADRRGQDGEGYYYQQPPVQDEYGQYPQYGQQQAYVQDPYQQGYYQQPQQQPPAQEGYGQQQAYVQDPYQQGYYQQPQQQPPAQGGYGQQQAYVQDPYVQDPFSTGQQPVVQQPPVQQPPVVQRPAAPVRPVVPPRPRPAEPVAQAPAEPSEQVGGRRAVKAPDGSYQTGEFTFVDEEAEESEDVIDWLKFAESRTERRDERRRKLRSRALSALVVLAVLAGGATGYLWWTGKLGGSTTAAAAAGPRQVNVVHLLDLQGNVSTALLVNDQAGHRGSILLLPDALKLPSSGDSPTISVGQAMGRGGIGPSATRDGLGVVLGAHVAGTWRLDTPYLELLIAQIGGVRVDTNADVHEGNKPDGKLLASAGKGTLLSGHASVAYATYQAPGENRDAQLARFGQVFDALVRAMPTTLADARFDVQRMNEVLDPSLPEQALAGVLAQLAQQAKDGHLTTSTLKVQADGTLDEATAGAQVKDVLGGAVHNAKSTQGTSRVSVLNASGNNDAATSATVQVTNAGLDVVPSGGKIATQATSEIRYTDDAQQAAAKSVATSLGLPETALKKVTDPQNADLVVVLGKDYQVTKTP